eukprot:comp18128_c0_seq1/m.18835 comp18128_c0_seq1/g.18835  ORF comp18128_c0_seq1/g.18835 comp18128_c0_seq1/m.18835 type:complete len:193 (-) comp18128_c0_seq1:582-1160(-)
MFAQKALDLVRELKRTQELPPFNDDGIRNVIREMEALLAERNKIIEAPGWAENRDLHQPAAWYYHLGVQRNSRCLMAYINERMKRVRRLRYEHGSVLTPEQKTNLGAQEQLFFQKYNSLLDEYMEAIGDLDLTTDLTPPKELYIEVRCEKDYGEIQTEFGPLKLKKNSQHFVRKADVEHLIKQGILTHVPDS